jgi:hypothetical protein
MNINSLRFPMTAMASLLLMQMAACKAFKPDSDTQSTAGKTAGKPIAIVQCSIPQGNGGNWAATLGWISEQMIVRAEQAEQLQKTGKSVGIYLGRW